MLINDISVILPELLLAVYAMAALMVGVYARKQEAISNLILWVTVVVFVIFGFWIGFAPEGTSTAFHEAFINDGFARFAKVTLLWGAAAVLAMSRDYLAKNGLLKFEFPVLVADNLHHAHRHRSQLEGGNPGQGIHDPVPDAGNPDDRRLCRP